MLKWLKSLFKGARYMTDGYKVWRYTGKEFTPKGDDYIEVGSMQWRLWLTNNDRVTFYDESIGWALLKEERMGKYHYWRAYKWPYRNLSPVRVYIGKLKKLSPEELRTKMRVLMGRTAEKRRKHIAEIERRRKEASKARKRRWARKRRSSERLAA